MTADSKFKRKNIVLKWGVFLPKLGGKIYLKRTASYVIDLTRRFNIREGLTKKDDTLPSRFFDEPLGEEKKVLRREDFNRMLADYYRLRGWSEQGVPR